MSLLKLTKYKAILTVFIFFLIITLFFPSKVNVDCDAVFTGEIAECPELLEFIALFDIADSPKFLSPSYSYLIVQLIISYILAGTIIKIYVISKEEKF